VSLEVLIYMVGFFSAAEKLN